MLALARVVDAINEKVGYWAALLSFPLVVVVSLEVFMRYVVGSPTIWGFETTCFLFGVSWAVGLGFTHKRNGHVSVDFIEMRMGEVGRAKLRVATNLLLIIPGGLLLVIGSVQYALDSIGNLERNSTSWAPAIYPYKSLLALGFVLFFLQGLAKLVEDLHFLRSRSRTREPAAPTAGVAGGAS
jgi:TRAP-type mannitol/chloroaromatic compound transport system permease small subunit